MSIIWLDKNKDSRGGQAQYSPIIDSLSLAQIDLFNESMLDAFLSWEQVKDKMPVVKKLKFAWNILR